MPKKKQPDLTPAEQKKRFEAMAREVGARRSSEEFKETLRVVLAKSPRAKPKRIQK